VAGAWAELPNPSGTPFDAALDSADGLFLFVRDSYRRHAKDLAVPRSYELAAPPSRNHSCRRSRRRGRRGAGHNTTQGCPG